MVGNENNDIREELVSPRDNNPPLEAIYDIKWLIRGTKTLEECSYLLREFALFLDNIKQNGWKISTPTRDGQIYVEKSLK